VTLDIRHLGPDDEQVLRHVAAGVFDHDVDPALASEFLRDPRHHLVVAIEDGSVVGFASGVHYVHPDKPAELWINEVGVAPRTSGGVWESGCCRPSSREPGSSAAGRPGCSPATPTARRCGCTRRPGAWTWPTRP
jgi:hypothetical protein